MQRQIETSSKPDYLAPNIAETARLRGGRHNDPQNRTRKVAGHTVTRAVTRRLLLACVVVPMMLWWALILGHNQGLYDIDTCFIIFVFAVAVVFGLIVCLNLKRLARMDAQRADTEEELKHAKESAENANRFKSAFFANISHEIRTPLTAINGFAELMLSSTRTEDERMGDARVIRRNGEHLLTLINDILDLSKIEAGKMSVELILCSPAVVVGEVCSMLRQRAREKGIQLNAHFEGKIPKMVRTDPTRLRQILINLVSNAIKFTKEGSVSLTVSITPSLLATNPLLVMKIVDTGIGIPEAQLGTLFEPFVQADASIVRHYGGTGLGLAIARHFARALGGDILVTSEVEKGSTFTVTVETGSLAEVQVEEDPNQATELRDTYSAPQIRIKGSILVAEDGIDNQALIAARLRQAGMQVEIAPNGKIACEKALAAIANETPFDLILMDVQMPEMDGFSATLHLRGKGYRGPIIALTANAMERDREKCLNAGCNDFVTKPIQMDALFKSMGRYLKVLKLNPDGTPVDDGQVTSEEFFKSFPQMQADIDESVDRQDRQRLRELVQLTLGKSAAAGLRDIAAEAARLLQMAEVEPSWVAIQVGIRDLVREVKSSSPDA